jgi:hypothetical protein
MRRARGWATAALVALELSLGIATRAPAATLDRTVARFLDPEAANASSARRFVTMRELVVESWLATFERSATAPASTLSERIVRSAFERHVIEALLGERALPAAAEARVDELATEARRVEVVEVGGEARLARALELATGAKDGGASELAAVFRRRARAELYLEIAVSQPIRSSDAELRSAFLGAPEELTRLGFDGALPLLRAYVRSVRLRELAQSYYQAVKGRLHLEVVNP